MEGKEKIKIFNQEVSELKSSELLDCKMQGEGYCPYEAENGVCTMKEPCKNHITK